MSAELTQNDAAEVAKDLEDRWTTATLVQDIDALVGLFCVDSVFLGSLPAVFEGLAGVREYFTSVDLKSTHKIVWTDRHIRVLSPDIFTCLNHVAFHAQLPDKALVANCAFSWVVVLNGGVWKIAQQHASVR